MLSFQLIMAQNWKQVILYGVLLGASALALEWLDYGRSPQPGRRRRLMLPDESGTAPPARTTIMSSTCVVPQPTS